MNKEDIDKQAESKEVEPDNEDRRKTILVFGASSFVGSNLIEFFKKDFKVIGTYHKTYVSIPEVLTVPCDVLNKDEVQLILFAFKPDITIYCVGVSSIVECAKSSDLADALNTSGLFNVAEYCQRYKSQICYISSGYVFGGERKNYIEMDIPDATTVYGKTQAAAEFYIQKTSLNYVIFRACNLYGRGINPVKPALFEILQRKLKLGQNIPMDDHVATGYLDVFYLAMIMKICFDKSVMNRLFQISSQDICTNYEFAKKYSEAFSQSDAPLSKGHWNFPIIANQSVGPRGDKLSYKLDIANIEGFLNIKLPTVHESLEFTYKRMHGKEHAKLKRKDSGEGIKFI